jgi:phosphopantothenoylcysteine synthetase/decarboxylase
MEILVPEHDVIVHAMAVSDFGFNRDGAVKLKSNDPQAFVDYMAKNIRMNPKVISRIKPWNPKCRLIGFKFEVGLSKEALLHSAVTSMLKNGCDLMVANDKAEMNKAHSHVAYIIGRANNDHLKILQKFFPKENSLSIYGHPVTDEGQEHEFLYYQATSKDDIVWNLSKYITALPPI